MGDAVADERDIDGAGGLHVRDIGRVMRKPDIAIGRILAAPASGSRSHEPHFRQVLLDLVSGLAGVLVFVGPSHFGFGQRPARQLRVEFTLVVRGIGVEERFTVRGFRRRTFGRRRLRLGCRTGFGHGLLLGDDDRGAQSLAAQGRVQQRFQAGGVDFVARKGQVNLVGSEQVQFDGTVFVEEVLRQIEHLDLRVGAEVQLIDFGVGQEDVLVEADLRGVAG